MLHPCRIVMWWVAFAGMVTPSSAVTSSARILQILQVPSSGDHDRPAMRAILEEPKHLRPESPRFAPEQLDALVGTVLEGIDPDGLTERLYSAMHVGFGPEYEEFVRRHGLRRYREVCVTQLWETAKSNLQVNRDQSRRYARAAITILAVDRSVGSTGQLIYLGSSDPAFDVLLDLPSSDLRRLHELIESLRVRDVGTVLRRYAPAFDRILDSKPGGFDAADLGEVLAGIQEGWGMLATRSDIRYLLISGDIWPLACLARTRGDQAAFDKVAKLCADLAATTTNPHEKRWLREALELQGAPIRKKNAGDKPKPQPKDFKPRHP